MKKIEILDELKRLEKKKQHLDAVIKQLGEKPGDNHKARLHIDLRSEKYGEDERIECSFLSDPGQLLQYMRCEAISTEESIDRCVKRYLENEMGKDV